MSDWTARPDADQIVAIVRDRSGAIVDYAYGFQAAQSMVLSDGYLAEAVADDGTMDVATAQRLYDGEAAAFADCWGLA